MKYLQFRGPFGEVLRFKDVKDLLRNNVEWELEGYYNGICDCGEEEYPLMTLEECIDYVRPTIYTQICKDGCCLSVEGDLMGMLARKGFRVPEPWEIVGLILEVARECEVLKEGE